MRKMSNNDIFQMNEATEGGEKSNQSRHSKDHLLQARADCLQARRTRSSERPGERLPR